MKKKFPWLGLLGNVVKLWLALSFLLWFNPSWTEVTGELFHSPALQRGSIGAILLFAFLQTIIIFVVGAIIEFIRQLHEQRMGMTEPPTKWRQWMNDHLQAVITMLIAIPALLASIYFTSLLTGCIIWLVGFFIIIAVSLRWR